MLSKSLVAAAAAVISGGTLPAPAAPSPLSATNQPPVYELVQVRVADANPAALLWEVRQVSGREDSDADAPLEVFPSLASADLRQWVSRLPAHSVIGYSVGFPQSGHMSMVSVMDRTLAATDDFSRFCRSKGVSFSVTEIAA